MDREKIRSYYRKCAGLINLMCFLFTTACVGLAIYIADAQEAADAEYSDILLNGFYLVFVLGGCFLILALISGLMGVFSKGEGAFTLMKVTTIIGIIISAIFLSCIVGTTVTTYRADMTTYTKVIFGTGIALGAINLISYAVSLVFEILGMKYYDTSKRGAKSAEGFKLARIDRKYTGLSYLMGIILYIGSFLLLFYFRVCMNDYPGEHNQNVPLFLNIFKVIIIIGAIYLVISVITMGLNYLPLATDKLAAMMVKITSVFTILYTLAYVISTVALAVQPFSTAGYPDFAYIIFADIINVFGFLLLCRIKKKPIVGNY